MVAIIIVENPVWFQKETSIIYDTYIVIKRFGFNQHTRCHLRSADGTRTESRDVTPTHSLPADTEILSISIPPDGALEGALNGWYECRLYHTDNITKKERVIKYRKDNNILQIAIGMTTLLAMGACFLGK